MKNRSRVSRAALAAMVVAVLSMSAMSAEASLQRAPADPIQRVGEGLMSRVWSGGLRTLTSARLAVGDWMIKMWDVWDYNPIENVRHYGDR